MQVIEAQCLLVLAPHDHLHIKQNRMLGVVVGAGLRSVAAWVYGRSMAGNSGVPHRSIAVMSLAGWQIAGRMA